MDSAAPNERAVLRLARRRGLLRSRDVVALGIPTVVLTRLADWVDAAARPVPEAQFQKMLDVEHGGMNEVLADLHALTGEGRYLALAQQVIGARA